MIALTLNLANPWSKRWSIIKCINGKTPFKHKFWELQLNKTADIIGISLLYTFRQDHAGLMLCASLLGYEAIFNFYDSRHWDNSTNNWYIYTD